MKPSFSLVCGMWMLTIVGVAEERLEVGQLDAVRLCIGRIGHRIVGEHAHVEAAAAAPRQRAPDPPHADDAERLLPDAGVEAAAPTAGFHQRMLARQIAADGREQSERAIGDRLVIAAEGHRHGDAVTRGRRNVDLIVADAEAGDHFQVLRRGEDAFGVGLAAGDRRIDARQKADQLFLVRQPRQPGMHDLEAGLPQAIEIGRRPRGNLLNAEPGLSSPFWSLLLEETEERYSRAAARRKQKVDRADRDDQEADADVGRALREAEQHDAAGDDCDDERADEGAEDRAERRP